MQYNIIAQTLLIVKYHPRNFSKVFIPKFLFSDSFRQGSHRTDRRPHRTKKAETADVIICSLRLNMRSDQSSYAS